MLSYPFYCDQVHQITDIVFALYSYIDSCNSTFSFYKYCCHLVLVCLIWTGPLLVFIMLFAIDGIVTQYIQLAILFLYLIYFFHKFLTSASFILCIIVK